jgi:hypothetical protein
MGRYLRLAGRIVLVAGCLAYVFWDIDLAAVVRALAAFDPVGVFLMALFMWISFVAGGRRLVFLSRGEATFKDCFNAEVLGLGLSNILPAKGGEVAKALYIRREAGMPFSRSLSMVFWERFFDLNAVFALGLVAAMFMGKPLIAVSLGAFTLAIWLVLASVRKWPGLAPGLSRLLVFEKLKLFFAETAQRTAEGMRPGYLLGAAIFTAPVWLSYYLEYHFLLFTAAGFDLTFSDGLSVFVLGVLGLAAPSSPGGIGVYEAVIVAALGLHGIEKENAVAAGLVFRFFQYVPITLYALGLVAGKGLPLGLRRGEEDGEPETVKEPDAGGAT